MNIVYNKKDKVTSWQESWVENARDRVHNLDLKKKDHYYIYDSRLKVFIMFSEVIWRMNNEQIPIKPIIPLKVYKDTNNFSTIGIGFNMQSKNSRYEWYKALGEKLHFDDVLSGKILITEEDAYKLFGYSIQIRVNELEKKFGNDWNILKPNEKISIISLYYNHPNLVGNKLSFSIKKYAETSDSKYLKEAILEVKCHSNKSKKAAVQIRRDRESLMLESYKCPLYSKPCDQPILKDVKINAEIGKTIIPVCCEDSKKQDDKKHYILRNKNNGEMNPLYQFYDGKIFSTENKIRISCSEETINSFFTKDFNIPYFVNVK